LVGLERTARQAIRFMAAKVRALADEAGEDLAVEARRAALVAELSLSTAPDLDSALRIVGDVNGYIDNWTDCSRSHNERKAERRDRYDEASRTVREMGEELYRDVINALDAKAKTLGAEDEPAHEARAEAFDKDFLEPARQAAATALVALCALVDARTPPAATL